MVRGKVSETELKILMVAHPQAKDSFFAEHFHVSNEAIRKRRRKLEKQLEVIVQADANAKLDEVVNTTKDTLEKDIETLRRIALSELKEAIDKKDKKALAVWYDKATTNAKLRADISKSLNILIDNRAQTININIEQELNEVWKELCPRCKQLFMTGLRQKPQ